MSFFRFLVELRGRRKHTFLSAFDDVFLKIPKIQRHGEVIDCAAIFGINEMIIFGFPIIMNVNMLIPFVLVPTVNMPLAYLATYLGLILKMSGLFLPWTTPIFVSGWLLTGSLRTVLFQGMQLLLGCMIYYPFSKKKMLNKKHLKNRHDGLSPFMWRKSISGGCTK